MFRNLMEIRFIINTLKSLIISDEITYNSISTNLVHSNQRVVDIAGDELVVETTNDIS